MSQKTIESKSLKIKLPVSHLPASFMMEFLAVKNLVEIHVAPKYLIWSFFKDRIYGGEPLVSEKEMPALLNSAPIGALTVSERAFLSCLPELYSPLQSGPLCRSLPMKATQYIKT